MIRIVVSPTGFSRWPELLALLRESFAYMESRIDPPSSLNRIDLEGLRDKAREETLVLALEGGSPVGCAFAKPTRSSVYVGKVAVRADMRGLGIARRMLEAVESLARQHELPFVELQTRVELVENHQAFAALGFVKSGETAHPGYDRPTSITMRKPVR